MSRQELDKVKERLVPILERTMGEKKLDMIFVMLTNILQESTHLIYVGKDAPTLVADAFHCGVSDEGVDLKGVVSRKKQMIPAIMSALAEKA